MKLPEDIREYFRQQGKVGARKRSRTLSPERRREIARLAANARWAKDTKKADSKKQERE